MKFSEAMLKGYTQVGGKQCIGRHYRGGTARAPESLCVAGAINLGMSGSAAPSESADAYAMLMQFESFVNVYGLAPAELNDEEKLPWEHIYGMAVAAGL